MTQSSISELAPVPYRLVAGFDFSALSGRVLEEALGLSEARRPSEVHVIVVGWAEPSGIRMPGPDGLLLSQTAAEQLVCDRVSAAVSHLQQRGMSLGIERIAVYVAHGEAAERICSLASSIDAHLIVLGTHGRTGIARWVLGSVAEEVVRRAECGVWVVRPSDFLGAERVPGVEPPLQPGQTPLKPFQHRPTYHYLPRPDRTAARIMPVA